MAIDLPYGTDDASGSWQNNRLERPPTGEGSVMQEKVHTSTASEMAKEEQVYSAWKDVVLERKNTNYAVQHYVVASWKKCLAIGVDPLSPPVPIILEAEKLILLREKNSELIEFAKPVLEMLEISVRGTGFITILSDKSGYVLEVLGDDDVMQMAEKNYYMPGCLRSSRHAGTNAISLSLEEGFPVQITGAEHFKSNHHTWTCSSAPIRDSNDSIIGAITLSGSSSKKHKHTLALVTAAAEDIQGKLRERRLVEQTQRLNYILSSIYNSVSDGILALDNEFKITHLNAAAEKMLGMNRETAIRRYFHTLLRSDSETIAAMKNGDEMESVELTFRLPKGFKSYICHVDPIHTSTFKFLGSIVTITEPRKMITIAKKIGGNYAKYEFSDIIGSSDNFNAQIELAKTAAKTNSRVLIMGESGTGKELFAQAIHSHSFRNQGPFVALSCAAIPRDLVESELFGYKGGAFTGARSKGMIGKFELADGGTLFLDEINGLPLQLQSKLLRVLQMNEIMRLGDDRNIPIDVRVVTASNTDLMDEVEQGNFREDLYYRLNVIEIFIPPLRDRLNDLKPLINHILDRLSRKRGIVKPDMKDEAFEELTRYYFPGNVRELENLLERALILAQGGPIDTSHIFIRTRKTTPLQIMAANMSVKDQYKNIIIETIKKCEGNYSQVARELKIARSTLYRKMREFDIQKEKSD